MFEVMTYSKLLQLQSWLVGTWSNTYQHNQNPYFLHQRIEITQLDNMLLSMREYNIKAGLVQRERMIRVEPAVNKFGALMTFCNEKTLVEGLPISLTERTYNMFFNRDTNNYSGSVLRAQGAKGVLKNTEYLLCSSIQVEQDRLLIRNEGRKVSDGSYLWGQPFTPYEYHRIL